MMIDEHDIVQISTSNVVYHPPHLGENYRSSRTIGFFSYLFWFIKWMSILAVLGVAGNAAWKWKGKSKPVLLISFAHEGTTARRDSKRF